jgi:hypothetical protein
MQETDALAAIEAIADGKGRMFFYRPRGVWGAAQQPVIEVDGVRVGRSVPGEGFYFDVSPGTHEIMLPAVIYPGGSGQSVRVAVGETVYIRMSMGMSAFAGRTSITVVDSATAAREIPGLRIYGDGPAP